jgi:hypothetical protein
MTEARINELEEIKGFYLESSLGNGPFPLEDIKRVCLISRVTVSVRYDFHASLDLYLADIAGIASHGKKLDKLSPARSDEFREKVSKPFFDRYHDFRQLEPHITSINAPSLFKHMTEAEQARLWLKRLLGDAEVR